MIVVNKFRQVFAGGATVQAFGPNRYRVGLIINPPSADVLFVAVGDVAASEDGIRMSAGTAVPWIIQFPTPNPWITDSVSIRLGAAGTVCLYEIVDRPG